METHDNFDPDAGYWAAADDPQGRLHPLYDTRPVGSDAADDSTSRSRPCKPMWRRFACPLWAPAGCGSRQVAPNARRRRIPWLLALVKRTRARSPATVFWIIGLGSPVFLYSLDLWEHTLGLACMAWGIVLLHDAWSGRSRAGATLWLARSVPARSSGWAQRCAPRRCSTARSPPPSRQSRSSSPTARCAARSSSGWVRSPGSCRFSWPTTGSSAWCSVARCAAPAPRAPRARPDPRSRPVSERRCARRSVSTTRRSRSRRSRVGAS